MSRHGCYQCAVTRYSCTDVPAGQQIVRQCLRSERTGNLGGDMSDMGTWDMECVTVLLVAPSFPTSPLLTQLAGDDPPLPPSSILTPKPLYQNPKPQSSTPLPDNQLEMTTKRTIMENEQMSIELSYQSRQTEKLLAKNNVLVQENRWVHLCSCVLRCLWVCAGVRGGRLRTRCCAGEEVGARAHVCVSCSLCCTFHLSLRIRPAYSQYSDPRRQLRLPPSKPGHLPNPTHPVLTITPR